MRIGVFGNHDSWYVSELCRAGQERGHIMRPLRFEQCRSLITTSGVSLRCGDDDLQDFDSVLIRTMPPGPELTAFYEKMRDIVLEDCPYAGSMARIRHYLVHPWLLNFKPTETFYTWVKYLDVDDSKRRGAPR